MTETTETNTERVAYTGPAATILESGRSIAPGTPIEPGELTAAEVEFFQAEGWLDLAPEPEPETPAELTGDELKARAKELDIQGRSAMSVDELRTAVADAEAAAGSPAGENGAE